MWSFVSFVFACLTQVPGGAWERELHVVNPSSADALFGWALSSVEDVNGDGINEILIGAPSESIWGTGFQGAVYLFSGHDGSQLLRVEGNWEGEAFGTSLSFLGDINGDGCPEFIVGTGSQSQSNPSKVYVISGCTGISVYEIQSPNLMDRFGFAVVSVDDLDGDLVRDFVVGAPDSSPNGVWAAGEVVVFSGKSGSVLYRFSGQISGESLGHVVGAIGDVDGDWIPDLAASSFRGGLTGTIFTISGATGQFLYRVDGFTSDERFGSAIDNIGDIDLDGYSDYIIGADKASEGFFEPGAAYVLSGMDGSMIHQYQGEGNFSAFGSDVLGGVDLDYDDVPDFAVAARFADFGGVSGQGAVYVYSGRDGELLTRFVGQEREYLGTTLDFVNDISGDEKDEIMFYENAGVPPGTRNPGAIGIYSFDSFLEADRLSISSSQGGTVKFDHKFPISEGGKAYRLLASSDRRGIAHWNGVDVPLAKTWLLHRTAFGGLGGIPGAVGFLDSNGHAITLMSLNPGVASAFIGRTIGFASVTFHAPDQPSLSSARILVLIEP
ncbi:MAG: hypothetical protein DWQ01_16680 [Planctomycetota bacterium]|nr:MAG: hypothetical protein DWQ01_16680 [Planctomycetota bacterium]